MFLGLESLKHSSWVKEVLGKTAYNAFLDSKIEENKVASAQINEWELARYSQTV